MNFCPPIHFIKILLIFSCVIGFSTSSINAQVFVEEPIEILNSSDSFKTIEYRCINALDSLKFESVREVLLRFEGINQVVYSDGSNTLSISCEQIWKQSEINAQLLRKGIHVVSSTFNRDSIKKK
ncbi:MAG: hypothetical protein HON99_06875 [Crocinitomicaceae bacterium]|jgi:hypothetical protein|nr:hypothetical protein [Crocinitomicaceae bacterium]MBT6514716.1 hypothetical protein [Crocinitomicaceae bacterium]